MKTCHTATAVLVASVLAAGAGCGTTAKDSAGSTTSSSPTTSSTPTSSAAPKGAAGVAVGSVAATPGANLRNGNQVELAISHFGTYTGNVVVTQCSVGVLTGVDPAQACDLRKANVTPGTVKEGTGTITYKVRSGSAFKTALASQRCSAGDTCVITVNTATNPVKYAGFAQVAFAN